MSVCMYVYMSVCSLSFLDFSDSTKESPKFTQDFPSLWNPLKPCQTQGKHPNNQGNALLKINQGNPKNQGKEGQGMYACRLSGLQVQGFRVGVIGLPSLSSGCGLPSVRAGFESPAELKDCYHATALRSKFVGAGSTGFVIWVS